MKNAMGLKHYSFQPIGAADHKTSDIETTKCKVMDRDHISTKSLKRNTTGDKIIKSINQSNKMKDIITRRFKKFQPCRVLNKHGTQRD